MVMVADRGKFFVFLGVLGSPTRSIYTVPARSLKETLIAIEAHFLPCPPPLQTGFYIGFSVALADVRTFVRSIS